MEEEEKTETWTIDELVALTETVQTAEIEYNGKILPVQWCELTEAEEPKMSVPDAGLSQDEQNAHYADIASKRMQAMINKANGKNSEGTTITEESWALLPTSLRWSISNTVMSGKEKANADF